MGIARLKSNLAILARTTAAVLFGLPLFNTAIGAEADTDKWYEIELIAFSHHDSSALQSENWVPDPGQPLMDKNVEHLIPVAQTTPVGGSSPAPTIPKSGPIPFQILSASDFKLTPLTEKLVASSGYKILTHLAWRQPVSKGERGTSVVVDTTTPAGDPNTPKSPDTVLPFIGVVTLTSTRYLHLAMDFVYRDPEILRAASVLDNTTPTFAMGMENTLPTEAKKNTAISGFRLAESRRIRLEQIQYYDHPLFGIIARVVSYEPPKPGKNP